MTFESTPELSFMMSHMEPLQQKYPGDGYKYTRVVGNYVGIYVEQGWEIIAEWYGYHSNHSPGPFLRAEVMGEARENATQDVIMRRELMKHEMDQHAVYVYPHEKIIGQVQRALVL